MWWIPFVVVVAGAFGANLYLSPQFVRQITDSIAGRDIAAAREYLEKLRRFASDANQG